MFYKKYSLSEFSVGRLESDSDVSLSVYIPDNFEEIDLNRKRPMVILCPGGGYRFVSDREGEPVALRLMGKDIAAAVLKYSIVPSEIYPQTALELSSAIEFVRNHADEWNIDTEKIVIMGFSAGGNLAGNVGVMAHTAEYANLLNTNEDAISPNAMVLAYPVITVKEEFACTYCVKNLTDGGGCDSLSLEKLVNSKTVPSFLWHTKDDQTVNVNNSLLFADALKEHNIKHKLVLFEKGIHGLSLADEIVKRKGFDESINPDVAVWFDMAVDFIKEL